MEHAQIEQIDQISQQAMGGNASAEQQKAAEYQLQQLANLDNIQHLRFVLEQSESPFSQYFCASSIKQIITQNWNSFTASGNQHEDMRARLLSFIGQKGSKLVFFVRNAVISALCRLTKLGWLEYESFKTLPTEVHTFFLCSTDQTAGHYLLGLNLLNDLVREINEVCPKMTLSRHRRTIVNFKENCLLEIFKVALNVIDTAVQQGKTGNEVDEAANLIYACLSYDFIGIYFDPSGDDVSAVQVPPSWREYISNQKTMELLWTLYKMANQETPVPKRSSVILCCMSQLAAVRRSLFESDVERAQFLSYLLTGTFDVLKGNIGLDDEGNYHEFCRLLSRIKPNYQLAELVKLDVYDEWIAAVAAFSVQSFQNWRQTAGCSYFLLALWQRLIQSKAYLNESRKSARLDTYAPDIVASYITSRLELARAAMETPKEVDNALENKEMLLVQLEALPPLAKALYSKVGPFLIEVGSPDLASANELLTQIASGQIPAEREREAVLKLEILDSRLSWIVYMMGSIIMYHNSVTDATSELHDASSTAFVLELSQLVNRRVNMIQGQTEMKTLQRLQMAILYFFNSFRISHVGETCAATSIFFPQIEKDTNGAVSNTLGVLKVVMDVIFNILKVWKGCTELLHEAISLFHDLAKGYSSGKFLLKLDEVVLLLTSGIHPQAQFGFLEKKENLKERTRLFKTLALLLFSRPNLETAFEEFMKPLKETAHQLQTASRESFGTPEAKLAIIGWLRDLIGVCQAAAQKMHYGLVFEWIFPSLSNHGTDSTETPLLLKICQVFTADNTVIIPLMRFAAEFVRNEQSRITFEPSSPNGILLFRDVSALVTCYGRAKLQELFPQSQDGWPPVVPASGQDDVMYKQTYKPLSIAMGVVMRALSGSYCNFGVFAMYGDPVLNDVLEVSVKMVCKYITFRPLLPATINNVTHLHYTDPLDPPGRRAGLPEARERLLRDGRAPLQMPHRIPPDLAHSVLHEAGRHLGAGAACD